jgi:deazaflavin-dependent oxidoreductase (nitroreductase family)
MPNKLNLPWWLKLTNPLVMTVNRLGLPTGPVNVLTVPGRRTGSLRSTPVTPINVNGSRYITTVGETEWVKNARAAGWARLTRGRHAERVTLVEVPVDDRAPILREFPLQAPRGVRFYRDALGIVGDADSFAAAAARCRVC